MVASTFAPHRLDGVDRGAGDAGDAAERRLGRVEKTRHDMPTTADTSWVGESWCEQLEMGSFSRAERFARSPVRVRDDHQTLNSFLFVDDRRGALETFAECQVNQSLFRPYYAETISAWADPVRPLCIQCPGGCRTIHM
jgi:hypothetical protein